MILILILGGIQPGVDPVVCGFEAAHSRRRQLTIPATFEGLYEPTTDVLAIEGDASRRVGGREEHLRWFRKGQRSRVEGQGCGNPRDELLPHSYSGDRASLDDVADEHPSFEALLVLLRNVEWRGKLATLATLRAKTSSTLRLTSP